MKEEAPIFKEVAQQGPIVDPHVPLALARNHRYGATMERGGMISALFSMPTKEQFRLFDMNAASQHELCNLLRAKARHSDKPPSTNGKRKK